MTANRLEGAPSWSWKALIALAMGSLTLIKVLGGSTGKKSGSASPAATAVPARAPAAVEVISFDLEPGKWSGWQDFSNRYPGKRWRQISWRTPDDLIDLEYKNGPKFLGLSRDQDVDFGLALPAEFRARSAQGGAVFVKLIGD